MAGAKHKQIHVLIDRELDLELERFQAERGLSLNGAVRFLLRAALRIPRSDRDAIWREVRAEVSSTFRAAIERAISEIPPSEPGPGQDPVRRRK